jgi:lysophospholipase L1-like esterase
MSDSFVRGVQRVGTFLRDAWLMLGSVLLILVVIELAYRGQSGIRSALRSAKGPGVVRSPYADSAWFPPYNREYVATFHEHWKPFVYFRRGPFHGSYINVDSLGHRRTVNGLAAAPASDTVRVFFFGGSTMWGTNLRDSATIASVASQQLAATAPKDVAVSVVNFGESGYVFTQELLELELQLRAGNVPDVVLFYDGINDMAAAVQYGAAGVSQNESNRSREFEFGRAIAGTENGVGSDLAAAGAIGTAMLQRVQFAQRLLAAVAKPVAMAHPAEWLGRDVARVYEANVKIVEALSHAYGFRALYVWQPALYSSEKRLTPFEQAMSARDDANLLYAQSRLMMKTTMPILDSALTIMVGRRFISEVSLFAGDTISAFTDEVGHTTEKAIPPIVGGFLPVLRQLVDSARVSRSRPAPKHKE